MSLVETLKITVLRIVEGFTERLPISSTGHIILVDEVIHLNQPDVFKNVFLVVIQLGAILTMVVMYFYRLNPFSPTKISRQRGAIWALWTKAIIACVPAAILGLLLGDWMEARLFNAYVAAVALIVYGVLFIVLKNSSVCIDPRLTKAGQISVKTALLIGMVRLLALIPGTPRSGSTTLGAMVLGCSRVATVEFSFFLGVPTTLGASLLKVVKYFLAGSAFTRPQIFYTVLGILIAFAVSIYSIRSPMSYVRKHDFKFFGYYRIILDVIMLAYFRIMVLAG